MTARKEIKERLMKARHYLQVSSEIIGKHRYPDKKIRPHYHLELNNDENKGASQLLPVQLCPKDLSEGPLKRAYSVFTTQDTAI
jgi:hypothetical protein